jgi:hypothetical protein
MDTLKTAFFENKMEKFLGHFFVPSRKDFQESRASLFGVSADRLHRFGRFMLQNFISFPRTWRVECPHTSVT